MPKLAILPGSDDEPSRRAILVLPGVREELDSYDKNLKGKFIRAFRFLSSDMSHPSLQVELIRVGKDSFYRARVDQNFRIHFEKTEEYYAVLAVGPHRLQGIG